MSVAKTVRMGISETAFVDFFKLSTSRVISRIIYTRHCLAGGGICVCFDVCVGLILTACVESA